MTKKIKKVVLRRPKPVPKIVTTIWDTEDCKIAVQRPASVQYQWMAHAISGVPISIARLEAIKAGGWKPVPLKRHLSDIPAPFHGARGLIEFGGLVLYEKSAIAVMAERDAVWAAAKKLSDDLPFEKEVQGHIRMLAPGMIVSEPYEYVKSDAPPVDVDVTIRVRLDGRFQDAANALHLSFEEYAARRLCVLASGEIAGLLLPVTQLSGDRSTPFEIREINLNERTLYKS